MRLTFLILIVSVTTFTAQDISFDWQRAEDFHNAAMYDSVLVHMPPVEEFLLETGFEKQRMIAVFYLANANTYLHNFNEADSLYKLAISLAELTGEENKRKEIYYRRLQIQTELTKTDSMDSHITLKLLKSNIETARVLGITDVLVSSLYEKAQYLTKLDEIKEANLIYEQILFFLGRYLPRSPLFERRAFFGILDNYVQLHKFEGVAKLLDYEIFKRKHKELDDYINSLKENDKLAFRVLKEIVDKKKTGG